MKQLARQADALKFEYLAAFVATADAGSLSHAAGQRGCSQSMLSRRVLELERVVGGPLFNRTGRGVVLTDLGQSVLPHARALLAGAHALVEQAAQASRQPSGTVEVALPHWAADGSASALINRVSALYPKIRLVLHESYSKDVVEQLTSGRLDIGVFNSKQPEPPLGAQILFTSELVLVGPRQAPLVAQGTVALAALRRAALVVPPAPNPIEALLRDVATGMQLDLRIDHHVNSGGMVRDVVRHSGCYTIAMVTGLVEHLAREDLAAARIVDPVLTMYTYCASAAKHRLGSATRAVERVLVSVLREQHARAERLMAQAAAAPAGPADPA
ncbi:LysR family transcriptional regulator [Pseudorhodoferax sp.]|uniref:LysR family transcriptional regulator n=1 Tax=Pseudorhodoferax sp. TaxID=1993553 RepID=UPI002DD61CDB|nr:LysR family transcriptional regulator [Pseudorhodoferax sp.]